MVSLLFLLALLPFAFAVNHRYIGCYRDNGNRDLPDRANMEMDPNGGAYCSDLCYRRGYRYAGTQYEEECWCGHSYGKYGRHDNHCNDKCDDNEGERCGDSWHNSVFYSHVVCGDGFPATAGSGGEQCDDGNRNNGDGCSSSCGIEAGWSCPNGGGCYEKCGDGLKVGSEACDDRNTRGGDGCSSNCRTIEAGWTCSTPGSACVDINECNVFQCPGGSFSASCLDSRSDSSIPINQRRCTCQVGTFALQAGGTNPVYTLVGGAGFSGCGDIPECNFYKCIDSVSNQATTCNHAGTGLNTRTCTCPSFYFSAQRNSPEKTVSLIGAAGFTGCKPVCGDATYVPQEDCEDGNLRIHDGCDHTCKIEAGWECPKGQNCVTICGDGLLRGGEHCDDKNQLDGDGCSADCNQVETRYICPVPGQPCVRLPVVCGDTHLETGEGCDDGNTDPNDGCSSSCQIEAGWNCPEVAKPCISICGDGLVVGTEQCDDKNVQNGDGCESCKIISGWDCPEEGKLCNEICGDGIIVGEENCDDKNVVSNDGCTKTCLMEIGWTCPTPGKPCKDTDECANPGCPSSFVTQCKESSVDSSIIPNNRWCDCEDGTFVTGQDVAVGEIVLSGVTQFTGCSNIDECALYGCEDVLSSQPSTCEESGTNVDISLTKRVCTCPEGWYPTVHGSNGERDVTLFKSAPFKGCSSICGDGLIVGNEICDDGNIEEKDGCSSSCTIESGFICPTSGGNCSAVCGDGHLVGSEGCDDSNTEDGDGCSSTCAVEAQWFCHTAGTACCPLEENFVTHRLLEEVQCFDGSWISKDAANSPNIYLRLERLHFSNDVHFCGVFVIDHDLYISGNATVYVHGAVLFTNAGSLTFEGHYGHVAVVEGCGIKSLNTTESGSLVMSQDSVLTINMDWVDSNEAPGSFISTTGCANLDGQLNITAVNIPSGSNDFTLVESGSQCIKSDHEEFFHNFDVALPGGCSSYDVPTDRDTTKDTLPVTMNYRHLCPGQIAGIVIGSVVGAAAIAGGAAVAMSGGGSEDYVAL